MMMACAEKKYFDTAAEYLNNTTAVIVEGRVGDLCAILQNNTDTGRIGDKCTISSIQFALITRSPQTVGLTSNYWMIRLILFVWKDDTTPVRDDILQHNSLMTGNIANQTGMWPLNHDLKVKRKILFDETYTFYNQLSSTSGLSLAVSSTSPPYFLKKIYIPGSKLGRYSTINFENNGNTGVNKVWSLITSNVPLATIAIAWDTFIYARINFVDL